MSSDTKIRIMMIGLEEKASETIAAHCGDASFERIETADDFGSQYEQWEDGMFDAIFCGSAMEGMTSNEMAQVLLNQCPNTFKGYATFNTNNYEPRLLIKNGFTAAFALPMDSALLKQSIVENILTAKRQERSFRTVRVLDLGGGDSLGFDTFIFMPLNKRYVRYTSAATPVDPSKIEKLQTRQMSQLHIDHRDMKKFYQYSADKLRKLGEEGVSSTEKQEKLKECVRNLFTDIFDQSMKADFDQGKEMIKQCESIISNYITKGTSSNWYKKLMSSIGESGDTYNHASNVSTFAALFAIGIGHKHPEDLAMAGLFHDLGMTQIPENLQIKLESELTEEEKPLFYAHIEKGLAMIKAKRVIIPESVEKAILQHHEQWSGRGYPKQYTAGRITPEAQILSFADQFDELTRQEAGKAQVTPMQALEIIRKTGSINPDLISQIRKLLDSDANATAKSA